MAEILFGELVAHSYGDLPAVGAQAPEFTLVTTDLKEVSLHDFKGKRLILNIFPSIDTGVCATSVRRFNSYAAGLSETVVACVSMDLPFAQKRFCGAEGISNVITLSGFRTRDFALNYGVQFTDGPFSGLYARAVVIIDKAGVVVHTELIPAIGQEPDYDKALSSIASERFTTSA